MEPWSKDKSTQHDVQHTSAKNGYKVLEIVHLLYASGMHHESE